MTGIQNNGGTRRVLLQALLIVAAVLWIFSPSMRGGWLMDDEGYLPRNPLRQDPAWLWKIWSAPGSSIEYYPIEQTVQWAQWQLWHNQTLGYHLTNVVLHIVNALLVWRLLAKFGLRLAWLGGLLFAVHPVQVESVAWISELKNTLSLAPFLLAMSAWIDYEEHRQSKDYFLALGLFLVSMLCKVGVAPFPVVILLYAWWKRGRVGWGDVKAAAPFLVVSLVTGFITILAGSWFQQLHHSQPEAVPSGSFFPRLAFGGVAFSLYFSHCFWPVRLLPMYPLWNLDPRSPASYLSWPVLLAGACWFWSKRKSWGRHALLGMGFFSLMIATFLGLSWSSYMTYMRFTPVMDHFLYVPIIGLIGLTVAALGQIGDRLTASARVLGIDVIILILALLTWESRTYAALFINQETLWTYALRYNPESWTAHNYLGGALVKAGRIPEAMEQFKEACELKPDYAIPRIGLAGALRDSGRYAEAIGQYQAALKIMPDFTPALGGLADTLFLSGRGPEAIEQYEKEVRSDPDYAQGHDSLGRALFQAGRIPEAEKAFEDALKVYPDFADAHADLGLALAQEGRIPEAVGQLETAVGLQPDDPWTRYNLGNTLVQADRIPEAMEQYEAALKINPRLAEAHYSLGNALVQTGRAPEAVEHYEEAVRIKPDYADAHTNLGNALLQLGQLPRAIDEYEQALRITPRDIDVRDTLGLVLMKTGRIPEAVAQFEAALQIDPQDARARDGLAKIKGMK